jgi:hypothetical protein
MGKKKMESSNKLTIAHFSLGFASGGRMGKGSDSPCGLREGCRRHQQNSNLIEKSAVRKLSEWGGRK